MLLHYFFFFFPGTFTPMVSEIINVLMLSPNVSFDFLVRTVYSTTIFSTQITVTLKE